MAGLYLTDRARLGVVALSVAGLAACGGAPPASSTRASRPVDAIEQHPPPLNRLTTALAQMPKEGNGRRNPFEFGTAPAGRPGRGAASRQAENLPELPLPLPQPEIRVLGVASDPGPEGGAPKRTAILSVGGDLVLAPEGALIVGRYRVAAIGEREVALVDTVDQHVQRLALR